MTNAYLHWLAAAIGDATRQVLTPVKAERISGGEGIAAYRLTLADVDAEPALARGDFNPREGQNYFVKLADIEHTAAVAAEADGLAALERAAAVRVPGIVTLAHAPDDAGAALVLEWLDLVPSTSAETLRQLALQLVAQHGVHGEKFGWHRDNFIGASPQYNEWRDSWCDFFRDQRLHPQLRMAAKNRFPSRMIDRGERLLADIEALFAGHAPKPSLLHGDLWPGNVGALVPAGNASTPPTPVIFDPACYYGDREVDIAMATQFGGLPADFFAAYKSLAPLPDGAAVRKQLYDLYHILNHANIFAGDYVRASEDLIERCLAEIG
jgi:protein-ribulosamine 3-kinase